MGCGPGRVSRFLRDDGASVFGLDVSPGMIEQARRLNPDISCQVGDMTAPTLQDDALAVVSGKPTNSISNFMVQAPATAEKHQVLGHDNEKPRHFECTDDFSPTGNTMDGLTCRDKVLFLLLGYEGSTTRMARPATPRTAREPLGTTPRERK